MHTSHRSISFPTPCRSSVFTRTSRAFLTLVSPAKWRWAILSTDSPPPPSSLSHPRAPPPLSNISSLFIPMLHSFLPVLAIKRPHRRLILVSVFIPPRLVSGLRASVSVWSVCKSIKISRTFITAARSHLRARHAWILGEGGSRGGQIRDCVSLCKGATTAL